MAGEFSLYRGRKGADFGPREILMTADEEEILELPLFPDSSEVIWRSATSAALADLDGDGRRDLLVGGVAGSFAVYRGAPRGGFLNTDEYLRDQKGKFLSVAGLAGPCLIDWDGDGDLDLLSGSSVGGVHLSENLGDRRRAVFAPFIALLAPPPERNHDLPPRFGDDHLNGPGRATRVWAEDVDGDGRLDLLVGDDVTVYRPGDGLDAATARRRWTEVNRKIVPDMDSEDFLPIWEERERIIVGEGRGHVWFFRGR